MGHFGMMTPTLFGSDALLVFSLVILIPIFNVNVPNSTAYETMACHIHSMVDEAKSLGDTPLYDDLYMFRKMVRDQSFDCLRYVHEADRIHVSADYRRDEVQPDQLRPLFISEAKVVLMDEGSVLLRETKCLLKWMRQRKMPKQLRS
ncbi:putative heme-binding protein 2-like [Capsicum annuum]|nr:putative heme-binding protein 2-like [Capsicum annuum]